MPEKRVHGLGAAVRRTAHPLCCNGSNRTPGRERSRSAGTNDEKEAEQARADLEYELNHGRYQEASRMSWERFRELFEDQYVAALRKTTRKVFSNAFNLFERLCNPKRLRSISEQTVSAFAAALRKEPGHGGECMQASTIRVRLQFLHTALHWAEDQGLLPRCPRFPAIKVPKKKPQARGETEAFERMVESPGRQHAGVPPWLGGWPACVSARPLSWSGRRRTRRLTSTSDRAAASSCRPGL